MLLQNRILLHFIALCGMNSPQRRLSRLLYVTPSTDQSETVYHEENCSSYLPN